MAAALEERGRLARLTQTGLASAGGQDARAPRPRPSLQQVSLPSPTLFNAVLQALTAQGKVELRGETARRLGRDVQLTSEESAAKEQISRAFEKAGLAVPSAKEVLGGLRIDRARAEKILHILLQEKVLLKVAEDLIFHQSALVKLRQLVAQRPDWKAIFSLPMASMLVIGANGLEAAFDATCAISLDDVMGADRSYATLTKNCS